jgi:transposase
LGLPKKEKEADMKQKKKATKRGEEEARAYGGIKRRAEKVAGVDVGAEEIVVCIGGENESQTVQSFGSYTIDLQAISKWLKEKEIQSVAMESTGVYWIPLFEELEGKGFECKLISSRSIKRVPGRKSDVEDSQWIQTLHSYGLLESSFRPEAELVSLRTLLRHREQLIQHRSPHILHMQKALLQMNIQIKQVLSDIVGVTGQKILRAIINGERNPQKLAQLRNYRCQKDEAEIAKALTGTWREEHLFILKQSLELYDFYSKEIEACDGELEKVYQSMRAEEAQPAKLPKHKKNTHSKNAPKGVQVRQHLKRISGVDLTAVHGISDSIAQTLVSEVGISMKQFPNEKHFCSWLGLAPKREISGGKVLKERTLKTRNRAGQALRLAAVSVMRADCYFGALYRRQKARLGPAQAVVATAHAIARVVYRMLKYKVEYEPLSVNEYEKRYREGQVKYLHKKAAKLGFQLSPT